MGDEAILRKAITDYLDGNYDHPRAYWPGDCPHGRLYYQECVECDCNHFQKALAACESTHNGEGE